ncbi:hypothetical protein DEU56DRAFT_804846 [Suillus clintonianus]|uniref:uncharacterized protein n=1 Tax=Suillus clintonianus TaxID=1904413 RepID=UPI001B86AD9E|nr:uncharacterized protein DEU56DRAFT_804846 [Suillus clintonianus]KAG2137077.1 hypothetical protein DEU56DRAFT_804846 [Suillus clintonianus]
MHACLLIPEIIKLIFCDIFYSSGNLEVGYRPDRRVSRCSLAALSRVCHSFKDIALDVLWTELNDLEPLFSCLPQDLWTKTREGKLVIRRTVTIADWSIFERYASRVRVLGHSNIFGGVDAEFIHAILSFSSQSILVPNLRLLECGECPRDLHSCMRYLLGPNLVRLHLTSKEEAFWTPIMCSTLSSLCRRSPRLQIVELAATSSGVSELALRELPYLRNLELTLHGNEDFSWLSCLVGLQELSVEITAPFAPVKSHFRAQSSLNHLVIHSSTLTLIGKMVVGWVVPCTQLILFSEIPETAPAVERALRELTDRVLFDGLKIIVLYVYEVPDLIDNAFTLRTFTPLMHFSSLKEISLERFCMSLLDDDALGSIVKSWPNLENLYLGTWRFWKTPPKITFRGLVAVLSSCPNLRKLGLVFDAKKVALPTAEKPGGGVSNTNITTFGVGCSPIARPLQVAVALSAVLPCLKEIKVESALPERPDRMARQVKWDEVLEDISVFTLIRRQEGMRL